ncbi:GntR family transcriptional regulator, trehalose operon transcriptional repressor [Paenibacillus sp. ov031]|nr:Trehalose operon transcriptional repressor [Paenibacillus sp. AD87]SDK09141.1 GntR family transcriptional regulator, trehalose operon transcriptional repressor [Paenibacillus sp. OK060]SEA41302.1 GntR family transcriptional regulator, trehalose operon transcriptional repressor [Paenibacillus sp. 276b]SHN55553.1 GntR family transcriptional regulator, trehalose operon transcriptional repressor [Paenibacillus sp. ov031]SLJ95521.1 GntR family transcriptional regulator, trehalose operon transcrip
MMNNKFIRIYEDIAARIRTGEIEAGTLLPSELDLSESYQTSRETIRKALKMLSEEGYIQKIQGKGSIVLDIRKIDFPISGLVSFKELAKKMGHRAKTYVKVFEEKKVDQALFKKINFGLNEKVWEIRRVRQVDGEHVILDKDHISQRLIPGLSKEICNDSIFEYIEEELGLTISFAKKEILVEEPTAEDRELLDLEGFHNVVVVRSQVYLEDASQFQFTEARHRPDKFRFVDFARRR